MRRQSDRLSLPQHLRDLAETRRGEHASRDEQTRSDTFLSSTRESLRPKYWNRGTAKGTVFFAEESAGD